MVAVAVAVAVAVVASIENQGLILLVTKVLGYEPQAVGVQVRC
jgi:hypothetical protein